MNQSQIGGSEVPPKPAQYLERHLIIISKGGKNKNNKRSALKTGDKHNERNEERE